MSVLFDSKNLFDNKLKLIPLISSTIRSLLLKILENSDGFINFSFAYFSQYQPALIFTWIDRN